MYLLLYGNFQTRSTHKINYFNWTVDEKVKIAFLEFFPGTKCFLSKIKTKKYKLIKILIEPSIKNLKKNKN